jgi:CRISPR/Cas system CSM-associated protein Csm2 small subunit
MPNKSARAIILSALQKELLEQQANRHQISDQLRIRVLIIVKASEGASNNWLKREYSPTNYDLVKKWRNRWADKQESLHELEALLAGKRAKNKRLLEAMLKVLQDQAGRGVKSNFTLEQEEQVVAMACKKPTDFDLPYENWTQQLLAKAAVEQGIVEQISQSKICTILKKRAATS